MQAMANLAILTKSCYSHNGGEFGKISPNSEINANKLNTWKPAMLVDLTILANVTNLANLAILTKSCHSHNGGEFGKISPNSQINANKLNTRKPAMLVDLTILANVTNLTKFCQCMQRVPTKWRIWRI